MVGTPKNMVAAVAPRRGSTPASKRSKTTAERRRRASRRARRTARARGRGGAPGSDGRRVASPRPGAAPAPRPAGSGGCGRPPWARRWCPRCRRSGRRPRAEPHRGGAVADVADPSTAARRSHRAPAHPPMRRRPRSTSMLGRASTKAATGRRRRTDSCSSPWRRGIDAAPRRPPARSAPSSPTMESSDGAQLHRTRHPGHARVRPAGRRHRRCSLGQGQPCGRTAAGSPRRRARVAPGRRPARRPQPEQRAARRQLGRSGRRPDRRAGILDVDPAGSRCTS